MNKYSKIMADMVQNADIVGIPDAIEAMQAMATGAACMADTINSVVNNETAEQQKSPEIVKRLDNIDKLFQASAWVSTQLPFDNTSDSLFQYLDITSSAAATRFIMGCKDSQDAEIQGAQLIRGAVMGMVHLTLAPLVIKHWETMSQELKESITEDFVSVYAEAIRGLQEKWGDFLLARSCTPNPHIPKNR